LGFEFFGFVPDSGATSERESVSKETNCESMGMQALKPVMTPRAGGRLLYFVGDHARFEVRDEIYTPPPRGWKAMLRTNLGRATMLRREIIEAHTRGLPQAGAAWRDLPMQLQENGSWALDLPITEPGFFKAKAYLLDPRGWQHWPEGADAGISVHPNRYRTNNTIYCAFARLFGETKTARVAADPKRETEFSALDEDGYTVIPPSGTLRDLTKALPHVFETLGCHILHLLPIHPTPTTFARFGRFGSPYAALDLTAIDPALVVFDRRTTGIDQFRELTYETHLRGGRLFLDIVINHTGWGSVLQENHPDWFLRNPDGTFVSPGAWGTIWEDLVELKHQNLQLWDKLAAMFLTWCRRGVDGFRCDAAYKVPVAAWQYIIARVQEEFPETIFLAEGLGGAWEATEMLLTEGGMQWAYSELFQNYSGAEVASYLRHSHAKSEQVGLLVHYSETHDNDRLAAKGRQWSLLRNQLCALTSNNGGFGFTCGVEWLAAEKIKVHGSTGLAWDGQENIVPELRALNQLLAEHPCFFDGALVSRLSPDDSEIYANRRRSDEGKDIVLVLINTDVDRPHSIILRNSLPPDAGDRKPPWDSLPEWIDLLGQKSPEVKIAKTGGVEVSLPPGAAYCLSPFSKPHGLSGEAYRRARAASAWGMQALAQVLPVRATPVYPWREIAMLVESSPADFLAAASFLGRLYVSEIDPVEFIKKFGSIESLREIISKKPFPTVIDWSLSNRNRITVVPPEHWLLLSDSVPFRATLDWGGTRAQNVESIFVGRHYAAFFRPQEEQGEAVLKLERYAAQEPEVKASIRYLASEPIASSEHAQAWTPNDILLLTNGRGGMARICVDLGRVRSKYDCALAANLHPSVPVDRHMFGKRVRVWVNADGFISSLDSKNLASFNVGPPGTWSFVANAGDGRTVQIEFSANMIQNSNTTVFRFRRPSASDAVGKQLPQNADVRLTVRVDIEDRNFHTETHRNGGADYHFSNNCHAIALEEKNSKLQTTGSKENEDEHWRGFAFTPAADRQLRVFASHGWFHPQPEWSENIPHPVEQSRAHVGAGDAYSPGWFELPLPKGSEVDLVLTAEANDPEAEQAAYSLASGNNESGFESRLSRAISAFVVRRGEGKTVIAGYPWFLDWGRDTFICARGLLADGRVEDVKQIVLTFARFEKDGTLPNTIHGEDVSNRNTSDAPLWFAVVCEELAAALNNGGTIYDAAAGSSRTLRDVLISIGENSARGTPNGIRMDPASGLIWSPSHFTWMDTNYPAGTPREGYPIEIQALWIRLLLRLRDIDRTGKGTRWEELAEKATSSLEQLFWLEREGYYSDVLLARSGQAAADATQDDALRSNCLFPISLGLLKGDRAQRCIQAVARHLVIPGALRTLAPLPVNVPLPIYSKDGYLLNDPKWPYWGRYEGDEDTRRKPAYHNGTAWCWTFPSFCEALARAWNFAPEAVAAARAYLGSMGRLLKEGCIGQLPEILDGDAPHIQRGCDAQAWSVTEALRVWKILNARQ
jgi:predicted glycogen debranching enzyme